MKNIVICTTGGTICTVVDETGHNDVSADAASLMLFKKYEELAKAYPETKEVAFKSIKPIETLSENMTIEKLNTLIDALKEIDFSKVDGLIILHGTDTLHITAPLMARVMEHTGTPTVLVSSHRTLTDPEANGPENLLNAVRFILDYDRKACGDAEQEVEAKPDALIGLDINTVVIYRNTDGISYIHNALELKECGDYSEDFYSRGMLRFETYLTHGDSSGFLKNYISEKKQDDIKLIENVLYIKPYVGINYDVYNLTGVKAVLHSMYHSSTVNTEGDGATSAISLLRRCREADIPFYIYPCDIESYRYASTSRLLEEGAIPLSGGTWNQKLVDIMLDTELTIE